MSLLAAAPASAADIPVSAVQPSAAAPVDSAIVRAAAVVGFNPENIIADALFYDGGAMTAAEIQSFLNAKIGACRNGKCLNVLTAGISSRAAVYSQSTGNLICSAIEGGTMPVSELIYRVQVACGISAKVILVTLQKEQGLTTSKEPSDWNLKAAMGASCPDTAPCDPAFAGVGPQILKGTQQLKTYKAARFAKQPGINYIGFSPNSACGGTNLNVANYATAALYSYTPYQPNAAALAAGYGLGDGCSSYGNRNFYNYYTAWFGSTQFLQTDTAFVDVSTQPTSPAYSVFAPEIVWLASAGITSGWTVAPGIQEFRPATAVTRDVMAAFLYRLAGKPAYTAPTTSPFSDVSVSDTFYREIAWLDESSGRAEERTAGPSTYDPLGAVTRSAMADLLYRFAGEPAFQAPSQSPFRDVAVSDPSYTQIAWLAAIGISRGWTVSNGVEFRPDAPVTRDVMAAFLQRAQAYLNPFVDVSSMQTAPAYSVFAPDVAWLAATGITQGWTLHNGLREYRPGATVTRDVMAAFLYRLAGAPTYEAPSVSPFTDVTVTSPFYKEIAWLASRGISDGWPTSTSSREFRPDAPVTRDVAAAFLYRLMGSPAYTPPTTSPFVDVPVARSFYKEISWLASIGVSEGWPVSDSQSEFRPAAPVARDVTAAFFNRLQRQTAG
ncbi:S-layer homology domain-containing protein [Microbacterium sp. CH-015]|uniref:S-layer homology domain-containing protein n=1 Tax=Microbacterium sp. CH-015 TaxID=3406734 RepID=UPI003C7427FC